jgi:phage terminase large subunit
MNRASLELKAAAVIETRKRAANKRSKSRTVYGIVNMQREVIRCWTITNGDCLPSVGVEPSVLIPEKLEKLITTKKKNKAVYGGRGGAKSITIMDILAAEVKDDAANIMCFREVQKSLKESVFKGLVGEIARLGYIGFTPVDSQAEIRHDNKGLFSFWGLKSNLTNMKSLYGYKRFWNEEAEGTSQDSLDVMGPTLRGMPNTEIWHSFNPRSSEDPISKRFITPYLDVLLRDGIYEDDHTLVIKVGYQDNPWFELDESLVDALAADTAAVRDGAMSQAKHDWIWGGYFNDEVEDALISAEWFDACVDAHLKLGFKPMGVKLAAHDPSDTGPDSKGYAMRHGSVVLDAQEKETGNVNEGGHWAAGLAIQQGVDQYTWDCDGMGVALAEQTSTDFEGKHTKIVMFRGSESPDNPKSIYKPAMRSPIESQKTIEDSLRNKRAQYYFELRDRCYRTYKAVVHGEYHDPDTLISFSSDIAVLKKIRAELCRMPIKPNGNGLFQLYTKEEMKTKFKIKSPNLGDSIMMLMRYMPSFDHSKVKLPQPNRPMRLR